MKTSVSILAIAALSLSACHSGPVAPGVSGGVVVSQARLVLPAVKGNPGAAYFTLRNENGAPVTLVRVDVDGAQAAQMHETSGGTMQALARVRIDPGQQVTFAPAAKHVMVFGLAPTLAAGTIRRIVLHFQDGKTCSAPLPVEAAGGGSGDMAGMAMGAKP